MRCSNRDVAFKILALNTEKAHTLREQSLETIRVLRKTDDFLDEPINKALKERERRGTRVLKLDDAVSAVVEKLQKKELAKARGGAPDEEP